MDNMYDNLGNLLNEALEKERIPYSEKKDKKENSRNTEKEKTATDETSVQKKTVPADILQAFDLLHCTPDMTLEEIKKNYRDLLLLYHPDTGNKKSDTIQDFNTVNNFRHEQTEKIIHAYSIISNYYTRL